MLMSHTSSVFRSSGEVDPEMKQMELFFFLSEITGLKNIRSHMISARIPRPSL